eukprot:jgi/Tetstr1/464761/TSEL_009508.t1
MAPKKSFKYVYIPADLSEPLQELELEQPEGKEVECLLDTLKGHFNRKHGSKSAAQLAAQKEALLKNLPAGAQLADGMLNAATSLGLVENIALLNNAKDIGFVGVNMYVDDEGSIKGVPPNMRASQIAACCGKPLEVRGDAFISRIFDNEDEFRRLDLTLPEVSSSAPWVLEAKRRHEAAGASGMYRAAGPQVMNMSQGGPRSTPARSAAPTPTVQELSPAEAAKADGNAAFKAGDHTKAVALYSKALSEDAGMTSAYNNRAMAYLKLQKFSEALADAEMVLQHEPSNVKALLRSAAASKGLGNKEAAEAGFRKVLELEPRNKEAQSSLDALQAA